ncbi:MaoC family dehydratase [Bacillus benzoevorans]|uniref:3-hydroxybutyryl-CoA dehydratase n=1 Tax=Bacillus benzoevorans TaxID=1456 RepID=A0A7X0HRW0_9BACI|nr:MaoC family dehydratase [Bacillus benzoevorans]MBB6444426.1 3-hydroxybutyryl-CoA dehydratase [Bacillus benzoevorans]
MELKLRKKELMYEDIHIGDTDSFTKTMTDYDIVQFARLTGDCNPIHLDSEYAKKTFFKDRIAHGILSGSIISTVIGMKLPGPNSIYMSQNFKFLAPVKIGDTIKAKVEVMEKRDDKKIIKLKTQVINQREETVVDGEAVVMKL